MKIDIYFNLFKYQVFHYQIRRNQSKWKAQIRKEEIVLLHHSTVKAFGSTKF